MDAPDELSSTVEANTDTEALRNGGMNMVDRSTTSDASTNVTE